MSPTDRTFFQNAWVVDDLEAAMKKWSDEMNIGPFFVAEHGPNMSGTLYRGNPSELSMRVALSQAGPMQVELIQPTTSKPCAYRDTVKAGSGIGFHHMCAWTHDIEADTDYFAKLGYPAANKSSIGDTHFAYYDTTPVMNCMLEVVSYSEQTDMVFKRIAEIANAWDGKEAVRTMDQLF
jgi:hypothetical protein